ncbi:MAG: ferrochelatase [Pseudomonadota bacterium]
MSRLAVVLFNLGGPDRLEAVEPFLFNLFNDPAIIGVPGPLRWVLAKLISKRRGPVARDIYRQLGGGSPLLSNTEAQAAGLEKELGGNAKVFVSMRYWHPRSAIVAEAVKAYDPEQVLLIPLYPQFSTTTSGSSLKDWRRAARQAGLAAPTRSLCCYPADAGFVAAMANRVRPLYETAQKSGTPRVLFSAHGLPKKIVDRGDPYQYQVERTAAAIAEALGIAGLDHVVCYQSRVGRLEWIGPATEDEIRRAGADGVPLVVAPIAFVSEHSETLVELDIEYRRLAAEVGVPAYLRAQTVGDSPGFIAGLARQARLVQTANTPICGQDGGRFCPAPSGRAYTACPLNGMV